MSNFYIFALLSLLSCVSDQAIILPDEPEHKKAVKLMRFLPPDKKQKTKTKKKYFTEGTMLS